MVPLVSVIVPAYNAAPWIAETLESVVLQTHDRLEVIVVDDGSTDDTVERVQSFGRRVRLIRQRNLGIGAARNTGFRLATGDYVALLDHDDVWLRDKLRTQLVVAARHAESGLVVCDGEQFDGDRILTPHLLPALVRDALAASVEGEITGDVFGPLVRQNLIGCPAQTLIPRPVVQRVGPMITIRAEPSDYDYYLRIAARYPVTFHAHSLVRWRYLPSSRSGPAERRDLVWALMRVSTLTRHLRRGTIGRRDEIAPALKALTGRTAQAAYYYGKSHDAAAARSHLRALVRTGPTSAVAMAYLAALCLPEPLVRGLRRLGRLLPGFRRLRVP